MKKLFHSLFTVTMFTACGSDDSVEMGDENTPDAFYKWCNAQTTYY